VHRGLPCFLLDQFDTIPAGEERQRSIHASHMGEHHRLSTLCADNKDLQGCRLFAEGRQEDGFLQNNSRFYASRRLKPSTLLDSVCNPDCDGRYPGPTRSTSWQFLGLTRNQPREQRPASECSCASSQSLLNLPDTHSRATLSL